MSDIDKIEKRLEKMAEQLQSLVKCDDPGKKNELGGYDVPANKKKAENADLVTFPKSEEGTHCGNCLFLTNKELQKGVFLCGHKEVAQGVTARMCCKFWDNTKAYRSYGKQKI